jgi:hypothetical protein
MQFLIVFHLQPLLIDKIQGKGGVVYFVRESPVIGDVKELNGHQISFHPYSRDLPPSPALTRPRANTVR